MKQLKFSALISVYQNDDPVHFDAAMNSITVGQTMPPDQIVLVVDGPIGQALNHSVNAWGDSDQFDVSVVRSQKNIGLAAALNLGLKHCRNEYVARMDSDDVSLPERFETQVDYLIDHPDVALLGGWYRQYDQNLQHCLNDRKVPTDMAQIRSYARTRTPFNHVTAMMKKSAVNAVGGYPDIRGYMEDWWVALRLLKQGYQLANLPDYLVNVRGDREFIGRRGGWSYLMDELANFHAMYRQELIGSFDLCKNIAIRSTVRLLPLRVRTLAYQAIRRV